MTSTAEQDTEQSVCSVYTVVYDFSNEDRSWKVAGKGGWSELHICHDTKDDTYRILAWTHETQEVLVNVDLNHECDYKEKSPNFHSFKDETGTRRGFGFHKSEKNLKNAKNFLETVRGIIIKLTPNSNINNQRNHSIIQQVPTLSKEQRTQPPEKGSDGKLRIHSEWTCPAKAKGSDNSIALPNQVAHTANIILDAKTGTFLAGQNAKLPEGFMKYANQKFGVKPKDLPRIAVDGYKSKLPLILVQMKTRFLHLKGPQTKGIFRLAPDAQECAEMKAAMQSGSKDWLNKNCDVNVIANLIKIWFRELPKPILNTVKPAVIELSQTEEKVEKALEQFDELNASLLCWLWDFCAELAEHSETNKMNIQNLGIVISPNLFNTNNIENPMKAMEFSRKVTTFFQKGILMRMQKKKNSR